MRCAAHEHGEGARQIKHVCASDLPLRLAPGMHLCLHVDRSLCSSVVCFVLLCAHRAHYSVCKCTTARDDCSAAAPAAKSPPARSGCWSALCPAITLCHAGGLLVSWTRRGLRFRALPQQPLRNGRGWVGETDKRCDTQTANENNAIIWRM